MGFSTHAHQKQVLALQINQAAACLLVLASLLPCAMPRAKSPPCLAAAAVRVLLLRDWVAHSAPHQSWHRPLLCGRLPGCYSVLQQTQCTPTCTHKNRERDQTNPKRASELNQNRPLRGQEEGRASFPMDPRFNSPSKNSNPRRGRKGNQKNKRKQKGATGTRGLRELAALLSLFNPSNSLD